MAPGRDGTRFAGIIIARRDGIVNKGKNSIRCTILHTWLQLDCCSVSCRSDVPENRKLKKLRHILPGKKHDLGDLYISPFATAAGLDGILVRLSARLFMLAIRLLFSED